MKTKNVDPDDEGELSYDKTHNAVTYKIKDKISVRLYTSTCRILINGQNNQELKEKFEEIVNPNDQDRSW